jgi:hypothetical protein
VCVEARGRVLEEGLASSRGWSSEPPLECRCKFLRKLSPRRPEGRLLGETGDKAEAATVGAAGAGAVYITAATRRGCAALRTRGLIPRLLCEWSFDNV